MHPFNEALRSFSLEARQFVVEEGNIDTYRFDPFPQAFDRFTDSFLQDSLAFLAANDGAVGRMADAFADDASRELLKAVLAFRLLGPRHVRLPTNTPRFWRSYADAAGWWVGSSARRIWPFEVSYYAGEFHGVPVALEGWLGNIVYPFFIEQYFFDRDGISIQPELGDFAIDAGGCFGDTALAFAIAVGSEGKVYSFEPMPDLRDVFIGNARRNPALAERIELFERAIFDISGKTLTFANLAAGSRPQPGGTVPVETISIDDFVRVNQVPKIDFIKMDIEGSEREALNGAVETIRRFKPKLAISAYHRPDDLLLLPPLIQTIEPSYKLYFDHYTIHAEESVIFAAAERGRVAVPPRVRGRTTP
jgi:FkbM family methyltransferase